MYNIINVVKNNNNPALPWKNSFQLASIMPCSSASSSSDYTFFLILTCKIFWSNTDLSSVTKVTVIILSIIDQAKRSIGIVEKYFKHLPLCLLSSLPCPCPPPFSSYPSLLFPPLSFLPFLFFFLPLYLGKMSLVADQLHHLYEKQFIKPRVICILGTT